LDEDIQWEVNCPDGTPVTGGATLATIRGTTRSVLTGERVALNFLGRLSGIATATSQMVAAVEDYPTRVTCTRKTTPGLRALEKYAVRAGGGTNHRFGLDDAVLIKDNHLAAVGSISTAVERIRSSIGHMVKVQVEVDTLEQLEELLTCRVDAVLLDNMSPTTLREAVEKVRGTLITEASGGVSLETARDIAAAGVDLISVGWLTHSAPALDVALEIEPSK
jgi:nicotinate-nucleotide pyrophosphorylase (carboxylating)